VDNVLGSARTVLAFIRIQEGTQLNGLTQPQPGQTEQVFHTMCCHAGCWLGGGGTAGKSLVAQDCGRRSCPGERLSGSCGSCRVFSLYVSLLLLFPLFAVLLNCPYPNPPVSACFFSILLRTLAGRGAATWRFCCRLQPKPKQS